MLKWLKQKPVDGEGAMSSTADKITDDPLATIQVHVNVKKSKNKKSNEIYAVSRVNPLFEEDDPKGAFSPGNNSGSSGYDSGPTSDDDVPGSPREVSPTGEEDIDEVEETSELTVPTLAHVSRHVGNSRNLFRDTEDEIIIHHEAALVGPDGRAVLQIVQQNPNFVKSIAVAVNPRRPLSPIAESVHSNADAGGAAAGGRQLKSSSSFNNKVHAMSIPQRGINEDATGVGKLIQKNPRYVQSIRIGPSNGLRGQPGYFSSSAPAASASSSTTTPGGKKVLLTRKPSVTFSERVDYVAEGPARKVSVDHDSIVTDSLLMLTSRGDQFQHIKGNWGTSKVLHVNNADAHNRRYAVRSNSNGSGVSRISGASSSENDSSAEENSKSSSDLEAFANSMKKSRPVKQMVSAKLPNDGEGGGLPPGVPSHSSTQAGDTDDDHASDERSESSTGSQHDPPVRPRTPRNPPGTRSTFGGIADHYAAAKEIAKEIESYSTGTTKSSKRSLVRDLLLSSRGRGGSSSSSSSSSADGHIAINIIGSGQEQHEEEDEERQQREHQQQQQQQRQPKELLRVQQQVYVKAKSKQLSTTTTSPANAVAAEGQDHIQSNSQQVPIYDALPRSVSLSHGLDKGNSSDRNSGEVRLDMGGEEVEEGESRLVLSPSQLPGNRESYRKKGTSSSSVASTSSDVSSSRESNSTSSSGSSRGSSNHSKVMLISGDSQNMVVDLSAVPPDLREAILAGTALITLPDGAKKRLEPGYTMIAVPSSSGSSASNSSASSTSSSSELKDSADGTNSDKNSGGSSSGGSNSGHSSAGEESPLAQNKFGTKNMTQIWNVMQHNQISATLTSVGKGGYGGKSKKFTTILPFHPNHDSNTSPDFTIEGHRLKMQMQKVQHGKQRRCWCRICGMLFFLIAFLGILVALSLIYTRGERYFGSV